jgi:hypothetical protein
MPESTSNQTIPVISSLEDDINVIYIDLFGFSAFLKNAEKTDQSKTGIIYKNVDVFLGQIVTFLRDVPHTIFASDSLFCCFTDQETKDSTILQDLATILWQFLAAGFSFSGGISRGKMQRKNKFLIGYPMVEAAKAQEGQSYPRIVFAKPVSSFPWVSADEVWSENGIFYFDYFQFITKIPTTFEKIASVSASLIDDADISHLPNHVLLKYQDFLRQLEKHLDKTNESKIFEQSSMISELLRVNN